jgi:hypothetical protein
MSKVYENRDVPLEIGDVLVRGAGTHVQNPL